VFGFCALFEAKFFFTLLVALLSLPRQHTDTLVDVVALVVPELEGMTDAIFVLSRFLEVFVTEFE
jgi:hypothetical protein